MRRVLLGALLGAIVGFAFAAVVYLTIDPVLAGRGDPLAQLRGFLWNLVPLGTLVGAVVGILLALRRR